jgi:gas vesicle protein
MNATGKIAIGFLIGTAIGTLTGLLLAPTTGRNTRKNINRKAKKLVKRIEGFVGQKKVGEKKKGTVATSHSRNGKAPVAAH